ncbi:MAG: LuxR C-terminal-related transcriptional regulator [Actinomycetota bacterium]
MTAAANEALARGRAAFEEKRWDVAFAELSTADRESALDPDDLVLLGIAAHLTGHDDDMFDAVARVQTGFVQAGRPERAARYAVEACLLLMNRGDIAQAGAWHARAARLLEDGGDCAEKGWVLLPTALQQLFGGDAETALPMVIDAMTLAERFGDADLLALCRLSRGNALVVLGRIPEGIAFVDDAMLSVIGGEVGPIQSGIVYCAVIELCQEIFDLRRAREWTEALRRWSDTQQGLVPFRGQCLVHRAEIMQLHGDWPDALQEAERAEKWLSDPPEPAVGAAHYQLGEIHRLRGDVEKAEESYKRASLNGRNPQPGMALLRLAQGQVDAAAAAVKREADEAHDFVARAKLLPALVEITLAADDVSAARGAADELAALAGTMDAPMLRAMAAHANGAVLLAEGDARGALSHLRPAANGWQELGAPYEAARVRVLIAQACRALGDGDSADLEIESARTTFEQLGAAPALAALSATHAKWPGGLTAREVEVLRLVASGKTNRAIADDLVLSQKTVDRHVSNIFTKLGISSRAAATAYAYENDLV